MLNDSSEVVSSLIDLMYLLVKTRLTMRFTARLPRVISIFIESPQEVTYGELTPSFHITNLFIQATTFGSTVFESVPVR